MYAPPHRNPAFGLGLVVLGASLFIVNAGVSRVVLRAGVDPITLTTVRVTGTVLVLLAGVVPFLSFWAERRVTARVRAGQPL